jgi:hypothetical protein
VIRIRSSVGRVIHQVVDGLERADVQPVEAPPSFVAHLDGSDFPEDAGGA